MALRPLSLFLFIRSSLRLSTHHYHLTRRPSTHLPPPPISLRPAPAPSPRALSTLPTVPLHSFRITSPMVSTDANARPDAKAAFVAAFDDVVETLMSDISFTFDLPDDALQYLRKVVTYNVPHGKLNRGLAVFQCYKEFCAADSPPTSDDEHRAHLLGWCVELLQAFFLVADDIMDDSHTRRGQPCFYRLPEIGLNAINDSLILETMIYRLLHLKFASDPNYSHLVALFRDIAYTTEMGQLLDLTSQPKGITDFSRFTDDALARIYRYKTSHYTFYLPVALGMRLAGVADDACYATARRICLQMGHYFQAQDDFLDAFGDPAVTGKVGTDIEDNTCTWLIVQALKRCSDKQRTVLQDNYGRKEAECVDRVKQMYREIGLEEAFAEFEQQSYQTMREMIDQVDNMPVGAFEFLLGKIHKRDK